MLPFNKLQALYRFCTVLASILLYIYPKFVIGGEGYYTEVRGRRFLCEGGTSFK
jgi:hypothetical protein